MHQSLLSTSLLYGGLMSLFVLGWSLLLAFGRMDEKPVPADEPIDGVAGALTADRDGAQRAAEPIAS